MLQPEANPESYIVVARRYRPDSFDQLIGQDQVATALRHAIEQNRTGHAYLFTGARGVGKTSTARIFAKCLNCSTGPTITPCNECDACQSISSGEDVDVLEIDGASNRGIDNIRDLRSNANIRPSRAKFKIYIIDEVHMLSREAFNALLKTLEEPPRHVKFIFCTTDPEKLPITVTSRCQRFDFLPVQTDAIQQRLQEIVDTEGVKAEGPALTLIAQRAKGSLRDSQSLLEQVLSFVDESITVEQINSLLGTADTDALFQVAGHLLSCESLEAVQKVDESMKRGVDPGQLTEQLLGFFRDAMTAKVGGGPEMYLQLSGDDQSRIQSLVEHLSTEHLLTLMQILDQTLVSMTRSPHARTLLEMAVVRICNLGQLQTIAALVEQIQSGKASSISLPPSAVSSQVASAESSSAENASNRRAKKKAIKNATAVASPTTPDRIEPAEAEDRLKPDSKPTAERSPGEGRLSAKKSPTQILQDWSQTIAQLGGITADMLTENCSVALDDGRLTVSVDDPYKKEAFDRPEKKQRLENLFAEISGINIPIEFLVKAKSVENVVSQRPVVSQRKQKLEMQQHPVVKRAIELFDAEVVDVRRLPSGGD